MNSKFSDSNADSEAAAARTGNRVSLQADAAIAGYGDPAVYAVDGEWEPQREADRLCFEHLMPSCAVLLGAGHRNLRS